MAGEDAQPVKLHRVFCLGNTAATPEFIGACNFLLEMHWRETGEIVELICSYLRPEINESLLGRYVNWNDY